jgi:folate-binding protein YgfZ
MNADQFASFERQYRALRVACGFVELADWSSVTLTGADRQMFLNNFCTNDVKRLTPGASCEAFFCNVKGKIIGHGLVTCRDVELVIIGAPGQGDSLASHLDRYIVREDVAVRDTTAERAYLLVAGEKEALKHLLSNFEEEAPVVFPWKLIDAAFAAIVELRPSDAPLVQEMLFEGGLVDCGPPVFNTARIEAGMPLFGIDFDDHNLPQEVGRNAQALSFTKGCYLGQETVARIDALGHVNQQLVGVAFSGDEVPPVGTELSHTGANAGRVTSSTFSPALGRPLALATVRREHNAIGTQLDSPVGKCEVIALPVTPTLAAN